MIFDPLLAPRGRVVHCKRERYDVYVGRPSEWGNPFVIPRDGTREEVIEKFRARAYGDPMFMAAVRRELRGKVLGCYCAPLACHADILVEIANT